MLVFTATISTCRSWNGALYPGNRMNGGEYPHVLSSQTCEELGWSDEVKLHPSLANSATMNTSLGVRGVCGQASSCNGQCGQCKGLVSYQTAEDYCTSIGARLCMKDEMLALESVGRGCGYDYEPVWTSSRCRPDPDDSDIEYENYRITITAGQHGANVVKTAARRRNGLYPEGTECRSKATQNGQKGRCCADAQKPAARIQCTADYGTSRPCCGQAASSLPPATPLTCPIEAPRCEGYVNALGADGHLKYGTCSQALSATTVLMGLLLERCAADYGSEQLCCGQTSSEPVAEIRQCPGWAPTCIGYLHGRHYGFCYEHTYPNPYNNAPNPISSPNRENTRSTKTCEALGWEDNVRPHVPQTGYTGVCGSNPACNGFVSHAKAGAYCKSIGARLCLLHEMKYGESVSRGCGYDYAPVWTSTPCYDAYERVMGFYAFIAGHKGSNCAGDHSIESGIVQCKRGVAASGRCCADMAGDARRLGDDVMSEASFSTETVMV